MPGFILHLGATVMCAHAGQAQPIVPSPRVKVSGQPVVTQPFPWTVAGCPSTPPCVSALWITAAVRVKASGLPVLLQDSQAVTIPNASPLNIIITQTRVKGT